MLVLPNSKYIFVHPENITGVKYPIKSPYEKDTYNLTVYLSNGVGDFVTITYNEESGFTKDEALVKAIEDYDTIKDFIINYYCG